MVDLTKYSPTELLKIGNDIKAKHDALKQEIINYSFQLEELEKAINSKILELDNLEKNYIEIVEILSQ